MKREQRLSHAQERRLLRKHLVGDFGGGSWATIKSLMALGYVENFKGDLIITKKGRDYCAKHHATMPL